MVISKVQIDLQPWLVNAYQDLTLPLIQHRAHHALLIKYISSSGEDDLINKLVMRLLCLEPQQNQPCYHCHSCQLFLAHNHPDFYRVELEKGKSSIGINQIRQTITKVYERAQQGGNKVIWIRIASLMTEAAANALLKTLEEPPENSYFILSDRHDGQLLSTIRSRCLSYFVSMPDLENASIWLKQHVLTNQFNDNELATALLLNENAPLAALSLLDSEHWQNRQQFYTHLYRNLTEKDLWELRHDFINQEDVLIRLHWVNTLLVDALKARHKSGRFIINRDHVPLVRLIASFGNETIIQLYSIWNNARHQLMTITGLNQDLIISNLLAESEILLNA